MALTQVNTKGITDATVANADLANEAVNEAKIQISNAGTNGQYLQKQSGNTGGLTWADVPAGVGGATGVDFNDGVKARFGTGNDLEIFHDGSTSFIKDVGTGNLEVWADGQLQIKSGDGTETKAAFDTNGSVDLYYDNSKCFWTKSGASIATAGHLYIEDSKKIFFGNSSDLEIYHDGTNTFLTNITGYMLIDAQGASNDLVLRAGNDVLLQPKNGEEGVKAIGDGAVELYYDNSKKFETNSTGVVLTGNIALSGAGGNVSTTWPTASWDKVLFDNSYNTNPIGPNKVVLQNDTNWYSGFGISNNSTDHYSGGNHVFYVKTIANNAPGEVAAKFNRDGNCELYYDNSKKAETSADGFSVNGVLLSSGNIQINNDTGQIRLGASQDLHIYHDGTNSYVRNGTGDLRLKSNSIKWVNDANNETYISGVNGGAVELYHNNIKQVETDANGILLEDDHRITFGDSNDGDLRFKSSSNQLELRVNNAQNFCLYLGGEKGIRAIPNGEVQLFYDDSKKLETTSTGVTVYGDLFLDNDSTAGRDIHWDVSDNALKVKDNTNINFGDGNDLQIYHNGTNSEIQDSAAQLNIRSDSLDLVSKTGGEPYVKCELNAGVELYYDNSKKFETGSSVNVNHANLEITDGYQLRLDNGFNNRSAEIENAGSSGNSNLKFKTNGAHRWIIEDDGHFLPASTNSYNIGSSSYRVNNLYVNDMHFSNEGSSNSVDGTWGDWTLQEGEEDIFMINNRSGKKYKMNLTEVS